MEQTLTALKPTRTTIATALRLECEDAVNEVFADADTYYWSNPRGMAESIVSVAWSSRCNDDEPEITDILTAAWDGYASEAAWEASPQHEAAVRFCSRCLCELMSEEEGCEEDPG